MARLEELPRDTDSPLTCPACPIWGSLTDLLLQRQRRDDSEDYVLSLLGHIVRLRLNHQSDADPLQLSLRPINPFTRDTLAARVGYFHAKGANGHYTVRELSLPNRDHRGTYRCHLPDLLP